MEFPDSYLSLGLKPYYVEPTGIVYCSDCFDFVKRCPPIDLVVTDPPYNISSLTKLSKQGSKIVTNYEAWGHFEPVDTEEWYGRLTDLLRFIYTMNRGSVVLFYDRNEIHHIKQIAETIGFFTKALLILVKTNPLPHFNKNGFRSAFETILWLQKNNGVDTFNFLTQQEMCGVDYYTIGQKESSHPTEKPISVIKKYIKEHIHGT
jgi:DNA modification methylase